MEATIISFQDIKFSEVEGGIKGFFLTRYHFLIPKHDMESIGRYEVKDGALHVYEREKRVWNKFNLLLDQGLNSLRHSLRDKECLYIHSHSGIPLMGSNEFGLVDRGSNIIEIKPLTGCNLACTFCSVNEGPNNKIDLLVEERYLIQELKKLLRIKKHPVEVNIGPQGEPLLYPHILDLIRDMKQEGVAVISINTNGTLLHKQLIDQLAEAGLSRINLSVHSLDQEQANELMGGVQLLDRLKEMISYCEGKIDVMLTPVIMKGVNDSELDKIITLSKSIHNTKWPSIGIQNYLHYPGGRNPGVEERSWEEFFALLEEKERTHMVNLTLKGVNNPFEIFADAVLPKPFKKGDVVGVELIARGRNPGEWLGAAQERVVTVRNIQGEVGRQVKVKLLRDKHNIFTGIPA